VPQLADADDLMKRLVRRPGVRYPVLVPNEKGLERALAAGATEIAAFVSASESYSRKNLRRGRDEAMATALAIAAAAKAKRLRVRAYISMVFADPDDGPTDPNAVAAISARFLSGGADEISLGDTIGAGTAAHVRTLLAAHREAKVPVERIGVHFHDTYGQGLANVLTALELGVTVVDASIGGIGGSPFAKQATGNLATEDVVWMLDGMGIATGLDIAKLAETTRWMAGQLGRELPGRAARALVS
jgi:hydroxymethylglutaryl-CoA lyase